MRRFDERLDWLTQGPPPSRKRRHTVWWVVPLVALLVLAIFVLATTWNETNRLTRTPAEPLDPFAVNILPRFEPVRFATLDQSLTLSGWWIESAETPSRGTIVVVHDEGQNRLPFGLDTADLYRFFAREGFSVLAFDLRASGASEGRVKTFGHLESDDVLAALGFAKRKSDANGLIVYAIASGTAASLAAYDRLPSSSPPPDTTPKAISELNVSRRDVHALLLDTPAARASDYVRAALGDDQPFWLSFFLPTTLPIGVQLASGNRGDIDEIKIVSEALCPMWITRNVPDTYLPNATSDRLIETRRRLYPKTTTVYETKASGHASGYIYNRDAYLQSLKAFLETWCAS